MRRVKPGRYLHYKGKNYVVIGTARFSEDPNQEFVVYRALYKGEFGKNVLWVRPKAMFIEDVEIAGKRIPRFRFIGK